MSLPDRDPFGLCKCCNFDSAIIIPCVRWYIPYKVSYRDLVAVRDGRNGDVTHTTIRRWVRRYVPEFAKR